MAAHFASVCVVLLFGAASADKAKFRASKIGLSPPEGQSTLVISASLISNNRFSRSKNLVLL